MTTATGPAGPRLWIAGARPRTLTASLVPVLVGAGCAAAVGGVRWWRLALTLVLSLALQVGVNYANDYSDGIRGTDADRVGPLRLTASGAVPARRVLAGALAAFGVAALGGLVLAAATSWWLVPVGAACIAAAWFYTGGATPYGYRGLGDVAVFVFFGLVAVVGSAYTTGAPPHLSWLSVLCAVPCGLLAVAVLVANNLRDIPKDAQTGKRTLAVLLGDRRTRVMYALTATAPFAFAVAIAVGHPWAALALLAAPLAVLPVRQVLHGASGRALIPVLGATGRLLLCFGLLLALGLTL